MERRFALDIEGNTLRDLSLWIAFPSLPATLPAPTVVTTAGGLSPWP